MILINGCSHTYGTDIDQNMGWGGLYKIFATKPVVNLAKEGCSNQYICKSTIEWCRENLKNQTDRNNCFVIVMFTSVPRQEYILDNGEVIYLNIHNITDNDVLNIWFKAYHAHGFDQHLVQTFRNYFEQIPYDVHEEDSFYQMFLLKQFLDLNHIPNMFLYSTRYMMDYDGYWTNWFKQVYDPEVCLYSLWKHDFNQHKYYRVGTGGGHFREDVHQKFFWNIHKSLPYINYGLLDQNKKLFDDEVLLRNILAPSS